MAVEPSQGIRIFSDFGSQQQETGMKVGCLKLRQKIAAVMASKDALTPLVILGVICVSAAQLQSSVKRPCPGVNVTFTCTIPSVGHQWNIPSLKITRELLPSSQGRVITDHPPFQFTVTVVMTGSITSTATVTTTRDLNGTVVLCRDGVGMEPDQSTTIRIVAPPCAPGTPSVVFSPPEHQFTITWNEPPLNISETFDAYFLNISGPDDLCGSVNTLLRFGNSTHSYACTGWTLPEGQMYTFTVQAANCGGVLRGPKSRPVTVSLQAPRPPTVTVTPLYGCGYLLEIKSQATMGPAVTIADGVDGSPIEYIFSYGTGSPISVSAGSTLQCTSSSCQHTFRDTDFQVKLYNVSVAARNVVGVGNASTLVTIGSTNNIFTVIVDVGSPEVTCQFLNGLVTSATCTIQYGTDPTYVNLPYTDSSSGTNVSNVTVPLNALLQSGTLYYYVASSMGVRLQGDFQTGCMAKDLGITSTTPDERCAGLQYSAQIPGGVVCYSGVTIGSIAVYMCNSTHHLEGSRFGECKSKENSGNWSGSVPQCVPGAVESFTTSVTTWIAVSITVIVVFIAGLLIGVLLFYCITKCRSKNYKPKPSSHQPQQAGPEYEEVAEIRENKVAYGQTQRIEMRTNEAYSPTQH